MLKRLGHVCYFLAALAVAIFIYGSLLDGAPSRGNLIAFILIAGVPGLLGYIFAGNPFKND